MEREKALETLKTQLQPGWEIEASSKVDCVIVSKQRYYFWARVAYEKLPITNVMGEKVKIHGEAYVTFWDDDQQWRVYLSLPPSVATQILKKEPRKRGLCAQCNKTDVELHSPSPRKENKGYLGICDECWPEYSKYLFSLENKFSLKQADEIMKKRREKL